MITVQNIIEWSKPHPVNHGQQTRLTDGKVEVSIVGGVQGLYGDFKEEFEVAIFDSTTRNFITTFFFEGGNDVMAYMKGDDLVNFLNKLFREDNFQVL